MEGTRTSTCVTDAPRPGVSVGDDWPAPDIEPTWTGVEIRREPEGKGSLRGLLALLLLAWSALGAVGAVLLWGLL